MYDYLFPVRLVLPRVENYSCRGMAHGLFEFCPFTIDHRPREFVGTCCALPIDSVCNELIAWNEEDLADRLSKAKTVEKVLTAASDLRRVADRLERDRPDGRGAPWGHIVEGDPHWGTEEYDDYSTLEQSAAIIRAAADWFE